MSVDTSSSLDAEDAPVTEARLAELDAANIPSDVDAIKAKIDALPADLADASDIEADIGDFSGQTNLTSLLASLGIPDVAGKPLYTCLITDRLDDATNGLAAIKAEVEGIAGEAMRGTDDALLAASYVTERGTDNAALASVCTEARLAELASANLPADVDTIKTQTDKIREPKSDTTSSPYTLTNDTNEQTIIEESPSVYTHYDGIMLDIDALTQTISAIKVYFKVDGTNYRENVSMRLASVPASIPMLFLKEFASDVGWKITIQMSVVEGASRSIPYRILKEENTS